MTDEEYNTSVLRRLSSLERGQEDITRRLAMVETKNAVDEVHRQNVEKRLGSIEDTLKWLMRIVIGAIVGAAVAFALNGGLIR